MHVSKYPKTGGIAAPACDVTPTIRPRCGVGADVQYPRDTVTPAQAPNVFALFYQTLIPSIARPSTRPLTLVFYSELTDIFLSHRWKMMSLPVEIYIQLIFLFTPLQKRCFPQTVSFPLSRVYFIFIDFHSSFYF